MARKKIDKCIECGGKLIIAPYNGSNGGLKELVCSECGLVHAINSPSSLDWYPFQKKIMDRGIMFKTNETEKTDRNLIYRQYVFINYFDSERDIKIRKKFKKIRNDIEVRRITFSNNPLVGNRDLYDVFRLMKSEWYKIFHKDLDLSFDKFLEYFGSLKNFLGNNYFRKIELAHYFIAVIGTNVLHYDIFYSNTSREYKEMIQDYMNINLKIIKNIVKNKNLIKTFDYSLFLLEKLEGIDKKFIIIAFIIFLDEIYYGEKNLKGIIPASIYLLNQRFGKKKISISELSRRINTSERTIKNRVKRIRDKVFSKEIFQIYNKLSLMEPSQIENIYNELFTKILDLFIIFDLDRKIQKSGKK